MDNRIMDLTTADNIIQEIASKGVTQINRLIPVSYTHLTLPTMEAV